MLLDCLNWKNFESNLIYKIKFYLILIFHSRLMHRLFYVLFDKYFHYEMKEKKNNNRHYLNWWRRRILLILRGSMNILWLELKYLSYYISIIICFLLHIINKLLQTYFQNLLLHIQLSFLQILYHILQMIQYFQAIIFFFSLIILTLFSSSSSSNEKYFLNSLNLFFLF